MAGVIRHSQGLARCALFAGIFLIICGVGLAVGAPYRANLQLTAAHGSAAGTPNRPTTASGQPQPNEPQPATGQNQTMSAGTAASLTASGPTAPAAPSSSLEPAPVQPRPCLETSDTAATCRPACSPCYRYVQAMVMCPLSTRDTDQIACRAPCEPLTSSEIATIYCE